MKLSPEVIAWCKTEALGQCLTEWGDDNSLSYEDVLGRLKFADEDTNMEEVANAVEPILVWSAYEDQGWGWLADQIASLYDSYVCCAEFALKMSKEG